MKEASEIKKTLDELRRQIQGLNFYLNKVKPIPKDRLSVQNLEHAKNATKSIQSQLDEQMYKLESEIRREQAEKIDAAYDEKLKVINSPSEEMVKNSQNFMGARRESVLGGGILKKSSEGFIRNLKKSMLEKIAKRNQDADSK